MATIPACTLAQLLRKALIAPAVSSQLCHFLDWAAEIKHEELVCTHLSACLKSSGIPSKREVKVGVNSRKVDIVINKELIEAKYHYEGDLLEIELALRNGTAFKASNWNSAAKNILTELDRGDGTFLLWHVCIRSLTPPSTTQYKLPDLIKRFYSCSRASTLPSAVLAAENFIDLTLFPLFLARRPGLQMHCLPGIQANYSHLISRLYHIPKLPPPPQCTS